MTMNSPRLLKRANSLIKGKAAELGRRMLSVLKDPAQAYRRLRNLVASSVPKITWSHVIKGVLSFFIGSAIVGLSVDLATAITGFGVSVLAMSLLEDETHELVKITIGFIAGMLAVFLTTWAMELALITVVYVVYDFLSAVQRHWEEEDMEHCMDIME